MPRAALAGHRGSDLGAWPVAQALAGRLAAPLLGGRFSRLLIDLNRPLHHRQLFSAYSRRLAPAARARLVDEIWRPHWARAWRLACAALAAAPPGGGQVVHWAVHSFTPRLGGQSRPYEVGLLFDPARPAERGLMLALRRRLRAASPGLRVVFNRPYAGASDGLTRRLRGALGRRYLGIELELNQGWLARGGDALALVAAIAELPAAPAAAPLRRRKKL